MTASMEEDTQYDAMFADLLDDFSSSGRCELETPPFGSLSPQSVSERSGDDDDQLRSASVLSPDVCLSLLQRLFLDLRGIPLSIIQLEPTRPFGLLAHLRIALNVLYDVSLLLLNRASSMEALMQLGGHQLPLGHRMPTNTHPATPSHSHHLFNCPA
jgi:hypothetical protein